LKADDRELIESDYWRTSSASSRDASSVESLTNVLNKIGDAGVFLVSVLPFLDLFRNASTIIEIGAGQGWGACIVKRLCPNSVVAASDISPWALAGLPTWEHIFSVKLDYAFCSRSYELPVRDGAIDCLFCFASAHHFNAQRGTLVEINRVLAPRGHAFYFYEPSCSRLLHRLAVRRVNRKRPAVTEDVLIPSEVQSMAVDAGLVCDLLYTPNLYKREPLETVYYAALNAVPALQRVLPCTATYHFHKP
jgi:SAM-dependent methyltransferase